MSLITTFDMALAHSGVRLSNMKLALLTLLLIVLPLFAHHSTAAYDTTKVVTIKGTVTTVDWRNPHIRIHVNVPDRDGKVVNWDAETWGIGQMAVRGLTNGFLKPGDHVSIDVFVMRDGTHG